MREYHPVRKAARIMASRKSKPDGVVSLKDLNVSPRFLDAGYEIERHNAVRGSTGLLKVFSLVPINSQNPTIAFTARIDDGTAGRRRAPDLDIDIENVSATAQRDFKAQRNGYAGHHTDRSPIKTERLYEVQIILPAGVVFEGTVSFKANFAMVPERGEYSLKGNDAVLTYNRKKISE